MISVKSTTTIITIITTIIIIIITILIITWWSWSSSSQGRPNQAPTHKEHLTERRRYLTSGWRLHQLSPQCSKYTRRHHCHHHFQPHCLHHNHCHRHHFILLTSHICYVVKANVLHFALFNLFPGVAQIRPIPVHQRVLPIILAQPVQFNFFFSFLNVLLFPLPEFYSFNSFFAFVLIFLLPFFSSPGPSWSTCSLSLSSPLQFLSSSAQFFGLNVTQNLTKPHLLLQKSCPLLNTSYC